MCSSATRLSRGKAVGCEGRKSGAGSGNYSRWHLIENRSVRELGEIGRCIPHKIHNIVGSTETGNLLRNITGPRKESPLSPLTPDLGSFLQLADGRYVRGMEQYCAIISRRTALLSVSPAPNGPRHWGGEGGNDPARLTRLMAAAQTPVRWCHRLRQGVMTVDGIRSVAGTRRPDLQLTSPPVPRLPVRFPSPHATDHAEPLATVLPGRSSGMLPQIFRAANQFSLALLPAGKSPSCPSRQHGAQTGSTGIALHCHPALVREVDSRKVQTGFARRFALHCRRFAVGGSVGHAVGR